MSATQRKRQKETSSEKELEKETTKTATPIKGNENGAKKQGRSMVMISYSHANTEKMEKIKKGLNENGITAWVDTDGLKAGANFVNKIGEAITDAESVISLLSKESVESKYCQDEVALAYVSKKPIFPVALQPQKELLDKMKTEMKLPLAQYRWHLFLDSESETNNFDANITKLAEEIKNSTGKSSKRNNSRTKEEEEQAKNFWERNFKTETTVSWERFWKHFCEEYQSQIKQDYKGFEDYLDLAKKRAFKVRNDKDLVTKESYEEFCTVDGPFCGFWYRIQDEVGQEYALKKVLDMDSTVRVQAIENLGKFRCKSVIDELCKLLSNEDNNVQAVAAIALARTGANSPEVIKKLKESLKNKDRLVRESGCLALGHMKAETAVEELVARWRNDKISCVRAAAQIALEQIGGNEAEKAMHMTTFLGQEIRALTRE